MSSESVFFPLNPDKLRAGEAFNFSIYVKDESPGVSDNQYSLFCRRGEVFNPGNFSKIKFKHARFVYYHRRDKEQVQYYLCPDDSLLDDFDFLWQNKRRGGEGLIEQDVFVPLAVENLQPNVRVPFDIFLKTKVLKQKDYTYDLHISQGDICHPALLADLNRKDVTYLYFRKQDEVAALKLLYHNLTLVLKDNKLPPDKKAKQIYNVALLWSSRFYYEKHLRRLEELKVGFKLLGYLLAMVRQDELYRGWLLGLRRYGDKVHAHSLNTSLLGLGFAKYLGWPEKEILEFSQGALLHDIGMMEIPETLLNKPGKLTDAERDLIKKHPQESCRIIKEIHPLNLQPMIMIFQHHEFGDGSGYLQGLKLAAIDPWARILRIIDSYEAMTSNRSWREKFNSLDALQEMRQEWSDRGTFDTNYLVDFIKFLSGS